MTAVDDRLITDAAKFFEDLVVPEGYKAELLRGDIVMMAGPDWVHNLIVLHVLKQIPLDRWYPVQTQDISIPGETSEPQPDLVVVEHGAFDGPGRLVPAPATTLLVEVVSKNSVHADYVIKRSMYAAGQVPAYLIIDPFEAVCVLLTKAKGQGEEADYDVELTTAFGLPVPLDALGIKLDTSEFGTLPKIKRHRCP
ncbi:Uma2 family endonuclease [Streptomyces sp. NBC_01408]|uniref:Uma2 family endonuclease n=1 Tax=Streptomyces sp. NBC_01408 TaxID=2903855 RepID=UPI002252373B|nr:Uma2 family endonuclease [Streptomyces sp. NBC_01408]MCX4693412.1 Uma2 family endonuclease [Streptomyces sp. NBC_01408]